MTDKIKNIHEAINAVMDEVGYVKKSRAANLNYSFAGEAALISAIRPSMVEHGIYMSVAEVVKTSRENYTTAKGTAMVNTVIQAKVKFTHAPSDTSIIVEAVGEGSDSGDKSSNKAMTGLYKYALRQTFCIETGDDPDKHASEERGDPDIVTDELWSRWVALVQRAEKVKVKYPAVERAKVKASKLGEIGVELKASVEAAEAQKKAGEQ